jgi:hypothetical protein
VNIQQDACRFLSANGMGHSWVEKKMEVVHEGV